MFERLHRMEAVPLVVLIASHGRPVLLGRALRSVAACDRPPGYAGCVVVENGPAAGAEAVVAEVAAEDPGAGLRYMHVARANKSAALNAALADVPAETLCVFFDDDVRVGPATLAAYAEAAGRGGAAYFGGPLQCDYEAEPPADVVTLLPYSARGFGLDDARERKYFLGANWAAVAGDIIAAGGFDPSFGPGSPTGARGQEKDMQLRLQTMGFEAVGVTEATVWHYVPRERCSPAWAVRRKHQTGTMRGRMARSEGRTSLLISTFRRFPRRVASVAKRSLLRDAQGRRAAVAALAADAGFVRGFLSRRLQG